MPNVPFSIALTLAGMLAGAALAWGVMRESIRQLRELVKELRDDVSTLRGEVVKLREQVLVIQALDNAREEATGRHSPLAKSR